MYLCIFNDTVITVYKHNKQKQLYTNQTSSKWKKVEKQKRNIVLSQMI